MTAKLYITDTPDPNDDFDKLLKKLNDEAILGLIHFRIARGLSDMAINDPAVAESAPHFFYFTQKAHLDQSLLHSVRIFDKTQKSATIYTVLNDAERHQLLKRKPEVQEMVKSARHELSSLVPVIRRVQVFRNKAFVHLDPDAVQDPMKFAEASRFKIDELERLLWVAERIVGGIRSQYSGKVSPLELFNVYDYQYVLRTISDAQCLKIKAFEAQGQKWSRKRPKACPS